MAAKHPDFAVLAKVYDRDHFHHDCYALFSRFMEKLWDWYYVPPIPPRPTKKSPNMSPNPGEQVPFANFLAQQPISSSTQRLLSLWNNVLQSHDKELYDHLEECHVIPTTFGINWTKLLFSRQFEEYYRLWDHIVASQFLTVDFILVAMVSGLLGVF